MMASMTAHAGRLSDLDAATLQVDTILGDAPVAHCRAWVQLPPDGPPAGTVKPGEWMLADFTSPRALLEVGQTRVTSIGLHGATFDSRRNGTVAAFFVACVSPESRERLTRFPLAPHLEVEADGARWPIWILRNPIAEDAAAAALHERVTAVLAAAPSPFPRGPLPLAGSVIPRGVAAAELVVLASCRTDAPRPTVRELQAARLASHRA